MTQPTHQPDLSQDNVAQPENAAGGASKGAGATPDDAATSSSGDSTSAKPSDPAEILEALKTEVASLKDQLLRTLAEMDNLRKRTDREKEDTAKYAVTAFARDILAVADNLRRAIETIPVEEREQLGDTLRGLVAGVEMTEKDLGTTLGRHGVKAVNPLDEAFDPHLHQAMFEVPGSGKPAGTVVQVLQPGYTLHGRLLRPALVGVAKNGPTEAAPEPQKT